MNTTFTDLPVELVQLVAYFYGILSVADVVSLCLTCKALNYALHGERNKYDLEQHKALYGFSSCLYAEKPREAYLALKRGIYPKKTDMARCLVKACQMGYKNIISLILTFPEVDPNRKYPVTKVIDSLDPLSTASYFGHADVVKLLLGDPRVDSTSRMNGALRLASRRGHSDVVEVIITDPYVNPAIYNNDPITWASFKGHVNVVKVLLTDPRVDPSARDNGPICWASQQGHVDVVELLLADPRVDPSAQNNYSFKWASLLGHVDVVELLRADPRVNP